MYNQFVTLNIHNVPSNREKETTKTKRVCTMPKTMHCHVWIVLSEADNVNPRVIDVNTPTVAGPITHIA